MDRFGEFLVQRGYLSSAQLTEALARTRTMSRNLSLLSLTEKALFPRDIERLAELQHRTGCGFEEALLELHMLSPELLERLRADERPLRVPLGELLRSQGVLNRRQLRECLEAYGQERDNPADLVQLMKNVEAFASLPEEMLVDLARRSVLRSREAGERLYTEGDAGDSVFLIETGLVRLTHTTAGETQELGVCRSGEVFGLPALLGGEPRLETADTVTPSWIWRIPARDVHASIGRNPQAAAALIQNASGYLHRLVRSVRDRTRAFETNVFAVIIEHGAGDAEMARCIMRAFVRETRNAVQFLKCDPNLDFSGAADPAELLGDIRATDRDRISIMQVDGLHPGRDLEQTLKWLHAESRENSAFVPILLLPPKDSPHRSDSIQSVELILHNSRRALILTAEGATPPGAQLLRPGEGRIQLIHDEPARTLAAFSELRRTVPELLAPVTWKPAHPGHSARLAVRGLLGREVGLVLGGGGAKGASHLGIIEVLEGAGIPIDAMAASSSGNMVAATWAWGVPIQDAIAESIEFFGRRKVRYPDWTLPFKGHLTRGNPGRVYLRKFVGDDRTYDCRWPYLPVAVDMNVGRDVVVAGCEIWRATRASMGIPGLFPMVEHEGRILADGALANNVPASHMRAYGADLIISVNISPRPEHRRFNHRSVISNMFRSTEVMMFQTTSRHKEFTDVEIETNVGAYSMFDFSQTERFIELGREAAAARLPEIRYLLNQQRNY